MKLEPLPQSKIILLGDLFEKRIAESNLTERASVKELLVKLERGYTQRSMAAFVDDLEKPRAFLVVTLFPGFITEDRYASAIIYAEPELRKEAAYGNALIETAEAYAKMHGAETLMVSSWLYKGAKGIDSFLKNKGFEPQETIFVKHLT